MRMVYSRVGYAFPEVWSQEVCQFDVLAVLRHIDIYIFFGQSDLSHKRALSWVFANLGESQAPKNSCTTEYE